MTTTTSGGTSGGTTSSSTPSAYCWRSVRGTVARFTRLDSCGRPVYGPNSQLVTDGFISVTASPQYNDGTETTVTKANGLVCLYDKAPDTLKNFQVTVALCSVNPALASLMAGYDLVLDGNGAAAGFRVGTKVGGDGFAMEVWSDVIADEECPDNSAGTWGYFLLPRITLARVSSDFEIQNDALALSIQGTTKTNRFWQTGPYQVVAGSDGTTPSKLLTPIGKTDHLHLQVTTIEPPEADDFPCGTVALAA